MRSSRSCVSLPRSLQSTFCSDSFWVDVCSLFVGEAYADAISRHRSFSQRSHPNIMRAVEYLSRPVQGKFPWLGAEFPNRCPRRFSVGGRTLNRSVGFGWLRFRRYRAFSAFELARSVAKRSSLVPRHRFLWPTRSVQNCWSGDGAPWVAIVEVWTAVSGDQCHDDAFWGRQRRAQ